ncbi:MAG: universal stress protein [Actinomycetota bacterium]|nr:universal stress protein [Actinomycetota bacterium]
MLLVVLLVIWVSFGAVAVVILRRRGHDPFGWAIAFAVLGPLAVPLAVSADRQPPPDPPTTAHGGPLDVLVAHDGSPQASAALDAALALMGRGVTSLTLADVVYAEEATTFSGRETVQSAQERLQGLSDRLAAATSTPVDTVVLYGAPARALDHFAAHHGYALVVAARGGGHGASSLVRRRVAQRLAASASVPVLIVPAQ